MPSDIETKIRNKFPFEEDFVDYSGNTRHFRFSLRDVPVEGTIVEAKEMTMRGPGYQFEVFSPARLPDLGELRRKIRKNLATRYMYKTKDGNIDMTHDKIAGRISAGGLIVDGTFITYDQLVRILDTYEGFSICVTIREPSD